MTWDKSARARRGSGHVPIDRDLLRSRQFRGVPELERGVAEPCSTSATCPPPSANYLPSCWRAGEIIMDRCLRPARRTRCARSVPMKRGSHTPTWASRDTLRSAARRPRMLVSTWDDDPPSCPRSIDRPGTSVQYGLAVSRFDEDPKYLILMGLHRFFRQPPRAPRDRLQAG